MRFGWILAVALSSAASAAWAQPRGQLENQAAALHVRNGQQAFTERRFDAAAREFEEAFELTHDPALLFNAGAAWEQLPDATRALAAYRRFLEIAPSAPNRTDVQVRIAVLERSQPAAHSEPPPASSAPPPEVHASAPPASSPPPTLVAPLPRQEHSLVWLGVGIGAGVLAIGAGVTAGVLFATAQSDANTYSMPGACTTTCNAIADDIDHRVLATNVLIGAAGVLGAAAIAAIVIDRLGARETHAATASAWFAPGGGGAVVRWSFQ